MKTMYKKLLLLLLMLPVSLFAQSKLEGTVTDKATGQNMPGVNVIIKGTEKGTSTDFTGAFKLLDLKNGDVITFSFLGYKNFTLNYSGQAIANIVLQDESSKLNEIVVIGYGSVKKKDATGSVDVITSKGFNKGVTVSVDQMIQGKSAGLQVISGGGSPGEGATIRIRGGSSLNATNDPLYVIDGVPAATGGVKGSKNPLATLNQNNIESITVLKDASSTAIYGSRASNGVILITTKKGKTGEMQVNYNANFSMSEIAKKVDVLSTAQFIDYVNNNGSTAQKGLVGLSDTDWQSEIYRVAFGTDHNVAMSGGVKNLTYRASLGVTGQNGLLKRDNMNRVTFGASLVGKFFDNHLKIEINNNTAGFTNDYSNRGAIGAAVAYDPTQSVRNPDGSFRQWNSQLAGRNPVALIEQFNNYGNSTRSIGNIQTEYKLHFFPAVKLVANLGYDDQSGREYGDTAKDYFFTDNKGDSYENTEERKNRLMDLYFNYKKDISLINGSFEFTGGYTYQNFRDQTYSINTDGNSGNIVEGITFPKIINLQSFFGRAVFNVADKYLLTATLRRDGSSRFTKENRWSNFPSAAFAWKLNQENFLKNITTLSNLKLRLGWGVTGQQEVSDYPSIPLYLTSDSAAQYQFGSAFYNTVRPQQYNSNLKWEQTETRNIGLDFGLFNNRVSGSVDVYEKRTKDLLAKVPNPAFFGFSNIGDYNIGAMTNQGIEISGEVIPVRNENWNWSVGGNITLQNSKITSLVDVALPTGDAINGGVGNYIQSNQVSYAPKSFYVYEQAYNINGSPIDGVFIDRNGDGTVNADDRYLYKKPAADVFYGLNTNLSYKNLDLSMAWRGSWGNYLYNNVDSNLGWKNQVLIRNTDLGNGVTNLLDTNFSNAGIQRYQSDYYVQDASYIKLDNVTLGYNFAKFLGTKANAKLSLSGQNLLILTKYKGIDPEISGGIDNTLYPRPRMYALGLNVNF